MPVRTTYDIFQDALRDASRDWERHFVLPYSTAYNSAYLNFEKTINEQKEADKEAIERKMQLALFALSLCGGSIFTHVFGSAVLKEVAAKAAVDTIINRGMERSFRAAAYFERNKTAQFMLGELWGKGEGWVGDKIKEGVNKVTKNQLEENSQNYTSLSEFANHPTNMENNLKKWLLNLEATSSKIGQMIADSSSEDTVKSLLDMQRSSYFFTAPPKESIKEESVSEEIELTFFMKLILDFDYKVQGEFYGDTYGPDPFRPYYSETQEKINISPTRADYPVKTKPIKTRDGGYKYQEVRYAQAGGKIRERINALHKSRLGSDFFEKNEKISRNTLIRAEVALHMLEDINHNKILKTLTQMNK